MTHRKLRSARMIGVLSFIVSACALLLLAPAMASAAVTGISGKVTNVATSEPIEGIDVCAYTTTDVLSGCSLTSSGGEYTISGLSETNYKVEFRSFQGIYATQWYNGKTSFATANEVAVTTNNTTPNINAAMQETAGKISGTVTDAASHSAINNIEACAGPAKFSEPGSFECTRTNASGEYTIEHLRPGSYKVEFLSPGKFNETTKKFELENNYVTQYYNGKMHRNEADAVTVTEGVTSSGINAAMQAGATITGTVTDATTNAALEGVEVCAWGSNVYYCGEFTDSSGNYKIQTVAAGSYKVEFNPLSFYIKFNEAEPEKEHWQRSEFPLADYLRQYWNDKFSFEAAEAITATSGATTSGINAKMTKEVQPPPPAGVAKVGPKAKVKGGKALLQVKCTGTGACSGLIKLSARAPKAPKKKGKSHKKGSGSVVIGKAPFSIPPGKSKTVAVKLNSKGKTLVKQAGAKGLKTTVVGTGVTKGSVTLRGAAPKKKKHPKS